MPKFISLSKYHIQIYNDPRVQSAAVPGATTTSSMVGLSYLLSYLLVIMVTWIKRHTRFPFIWSMERKTRFELATFSLARRCSTTEPLPLIKLLPRGRIELPTPAFSVLCSTTELPRRLNYSIKLILFGIYNNGPGRDRTYDQSVMSRPLYH